MAIHFAVIPVRRTCCGRDLPGRAGDLRKRANLSCNLPACQMYRRKKLRVGAELALARRKWRKTKSRIDHQQSGEASNAPQSESAPQRLDEFHEVRGWGGLPILMAIDRATVT